MAKKTGIGNLIRAAQPTAGDKASPATTDNQARTVGKSSDADYSKLCIYLPKVLIKRLKVAAIDTEQDQSDITAQALEAWLDKQGD